MKKQIILFVLSISLAFCAGAQQDSTAKRDTVPVPVYIIEVTDTVQVPNLLYKSGKENVKVASPGYYIRKYLATPNKEGRLQPVDQPQLIGALDSRKRKVNPI